MKQKLILHIPHSSTNIPFTDGFIIDEDSLQKEILKLTDWHTEDLFYSKDNEMIVADFSRIFCDVERFSDDPLEVMAKYGMGVLYKKTDNGKEMRTVSQELRDKILTDFYWKHHEKLDKAVDNQLNHFGKALIIDCHSFANTPFKRDLNQDPNRPDINIGTDPFHTSKELIDLSVKFFKDKGFSIGIDWPYSGSIVPLKHYQKNRNVNSIMIEINRKLYLHNNTNIKSDNYCAIKTTVQDFIKMIE